MIPPLLSIRSLMILLLLAGSARLLAGETAAPRWEDELARQLPLMGHRNWIIIADAAYPWQTASGVRTLVTDMSCDPTVRSDRVCAIRQGQAVACCSGATVDGSKTFMIVPFSRDLE